MQVDKGDARLLEPLTERIIMGAVSGLPMRLVKGSLKASTGTPLPTRCEKAGSMPSRNGEIVVFCDDVIVGE
jgi:hypothetical protein